MRVNHAGDSVIIDMAMPCSNSFDASDRFFLGLVREHRASNHIADGVDAFHTGRKIPVDWNISLLVQFNPDGVQTEVFRIRHASDGHEHAIASNWFGAFAFNDALTFLDTRASNI